MCVNVSGSSESSECDCHVSVCEGLLCVALWASLGNDLLAHSLTSFVSDVTSSGRPSHITLLTQAVSMSVSDSTVFHHFLEKILFSYS